MKKQQSGFTLVELIMVIVVLGILAAFALPRFADFGGEARVASVEGLAGALRSAASIAHARQLANNGVPTDSVTLEDQSITMVGGFPTADSAGIVLAAQVDGFTPTGGGTTATSTITFTPDGYTPSTGTKCEVTYTPVPTAGAERVVAEVGGCQ